jgi:hypothetical protein
MWPHKQANPLDFRPTGICDRSGFLRDLSDLSWQWDVRGASLQNLHLRVRPEDYDSPAWFLAPIIITGPEGVVRDPRPWSYQQEAASPSGKQLPVLPNFPLAEALET